VLLMFFLWRGLIHSQHMPKCLARLFAYRRCQRNSWC
jgi:hypothetical protein